jgi:tetratricopeptide (TPR) repeat protein
VIFLLAALLWQSDWNTAFTKAKQEHKLVLVDYYQAPCHRCFDIEHLADDEPAFARALGDFVLLRVDLAHTAVPPEHRYSPPAFVIFDADGRERLRIADDHATLRADDWHLPVSRKSVTLVDPHAERYGSFEVGSIVDPIVQFHTAASVFVQAAELFDTGHDLEANFLVANAYTRLKMTEHARDAYGAAKKIAEKQGNAAAAQVADVQSALTFIAEQRAAHAVELLKPLTNAPANRETEALIWLALGHAYEAALDNAEAVGAYRHAEALAAEGSRTRADATASLKRLH